MAQLSISRNSLPNVRKNNELMVNAIQRCASIVVQNSLREGFGLTITEAMWKGTPVLGTEAWANSSTTSSPSSVFETRTSSTTLFLASSALDSSSPNISA